MEFFRLLSNPNDLLPQDFKNVSEMIINRMKARRNMFMLEPSYYRALSAIASKLGAPIIACMVEEGVVPREGALVASVACYLLKNVSKGRDTYRMDIANRLVKDDLMENKPLVQSKVTKLSVARAQALELEDEIQELVEKQPTATTLTGNSGLRALAILSKISLDLHQAVINKKSPWSDLSFTSNFNNSIDLYFSNFVSIEKLMPMHDLILAVIVPISPEASLNLKASLDNHMSGSHHFHL